ncbi:AraC family transcriptional regulator [Zobellella iuensis]|uniref:Helix-turn-helix transcriptional regulator n=1 Tax=Zobellella iuensis TaxID=2803811 RepID=A0ABS1QQ06_9GAMM|nr:helix-turn-helix transcriptional regulator [Zobellella iuensis]MBL1376961.1 helix-turn-helix transcriptional regulator [Zobellella iuensis]
MEKYGNNQGAGPPPAERQLHQPPFSERLPAPIYFRAAAMPAAASYPQHRHPWGEFVYSYSGVMEVRVGHRQYLAPSQYGLWLPPKVEHQGFNRQEACHCSLYVSAELCRRLPAVPCALTVTPLIGALLEQLRQRPPRQPYSEEDSRLLQVLVDQLAATDCAGSYLPGSDDPLLGRVLAMLEAEPGDNRPLAELARAVHSTERTLLRRSQKELGMSLTEWRQRLRVIRAMTLLEEGRKVESIALELGYAGASAFIAMFRRLMGMTPDEYRKSLRTGG